MFSYLLTKEEPHKSLLFPMEWAVFTYIAFTFVLMAILGSQLSEPLLMLRTRSICIIALAAVIAISRRWPCRLTTLLRLCTPLALLSQLYPDTYEFSRTFDNMDHIFASIDQSLFGCQPSLVFSERVHSWLFNEAVCMGYSAYFILIAVTLVWFWLRRNDEVQRAGFVIMVSFFLYYIVFLFVPVGGPQYYYQAEGVDAANAVFPELGRYFDTHTELLPMPFQDDAGPFCQMVQMAHDAGERPTAAFPSSHIGITNILLLLALCYRQRRLALLLTPFFILLCLATVYIHAHYLIDAICGFFSSILVFFLVDWAYTRLFTKGKQA